MKYLVCDYGIVPVMHNDPRYGEELAFSTFKEAAIVAIQMMAIRIMELEKKAEEKK